MKPTHPKAQLKAVLKHFEIDGDFVDATPYGNGHINDTYAAGFDQGGAPVRYILQRVNHEVFKDPVKVMENIERVTAHIRKSLEAQGVERISSKVLTLLPSTAGPTWHQDPEGNFWRVYVFVEQATSFDQIETQAQAYEAAKAFGGFQKLLADLPAPRLHETIAGFHHTRGRFDALVRAVQGDVCNRATRVKSEIDFVLERERQVDVLLDLLAQGRLRERVTHNDTKLNNVLIDNSTNKGLCVIDLDTVMPGLILYDFGDLCRTATRPTPEDERDLTKVVMRLDLFEAIVAGYLESAADFLSAVEKDHLAFSASLITLEIGIRFLTDYLEGDRYFKTHSPDHNADRARVQFQMVRSFEAQAAALEDAVQHGGHRPG